jgi:hypothetical protein
MIHAQALYRLGGENLDPKSAGLADGTAGQVVAAQPGGKAQVILNAGTRTRLTTGSFPLDQYRVQPLGGTVDRRR